MTPTGTSSAASLSALRRELHQIPEVGLDLPQTHARILAEFSALPLEITGAQGSSGFAAVLRGAAPDAATGADRPIVLLRADMDALPVTEETGLGYASANGAMHACGHDLHMAAIVGAARTLCAERDRLRGDVLFLLQPGEEGFDGAKRIIAEGLLEAAGKLPDHAYGLHVWSSTYATGSIVSRAGALMAGADALEVRVVGRGGHGSAPQHAIDPVPILCEMVTQSQVMIARQFDAFDPVVMACGSIHAGSACNVIPDEAWASFSVRTFSHATRDKMISAVTQLFTHLAQARGASCEVSFERPMPPTINDPAEVDFVEAAVQRRFPERWSRLDHPVAASEDFSLILEQIPGAFIFVSAVPDDVDPISAPANHSPQAVFDDTVLEDAADLLTELVLGRLAAQV